MARNKPISEDRKKLVIEKSLLGKRTSEIAEECHISKTSVDTIKRNYNKTGALSNPKKKTGRKDKLREEGVIKLCRLLLKKPDYYLDELAAKVTKHQIKHLIGDPNDLSVSVTTVWRVLKKLNYSRKQLSKRAKERNENERISYQIRMKKYSSEQLVFIDESAKDDRTQHRRFGYSLSGTRAEKNCIYIRGKRYTLEAALGRSGIIAHKIKEGAMTSDDFYDFVTQNLLPVMNPFPGPRSVLIMDNASIHKTFKVQEILIEYGVMIIYLPPYSPDFNPIEQCFFYIKSFLRRYNEWMEREQDPFYVLDVACSMIGPEKARACYSNAGY